MSAAREPLRESREGGWRELPFFQGLVQALRPPWQSTRGHGDGGCAATPVIGGFGDLPNAKEIGVGLRGCGALELCLLRATGKLCVPCPAEGFRESWCVSELPFYTSVGMTRWSCRARWLERWRVVPRSGCPQVWSSCSSLCRP